MAVEDCWGALYSLHFPGFQGFENHSMFLNYSKQCNLLVMAKLQKLSPYPDRFLQSSAFLISKEIYDIGTYRMLLISLKLKDIIKKTRCCST